MSKERKGQLFGSILLTVWIGACVGIVASADGLMMVVPALILLWIVGVWSIWTS